MDGVNSIEAVAKKIKDDLNSRNQKKNISLLYAFNATGKTRISTTLTDSMDEDKVLCYNAFVEDLFTWDNDNFIFKINPSCWLVEFIKEQGLENQIIENFTHILNSKVEPSFELDKGEIIFNIATGDSNYDKGIKISKGEESVFIWSIFYTILETAIDTLNMDKDDRLTEFFNNLEYIIVDDPVSSIDDSKIISIAMMIIEIIERYKNNSNHKLKFLITTHHALFYNVIYNQYRKNGDYNFKPVILKKNDKMYELKNQRADSPFGYHLMIKEEIERAINQEDIQKYHFNLFRNLLEKTSNFLGYHNWNECVESDKKQEFMRIINLYSHSRLSDVEYKELTYDDKELFKSTYYKFVENFKWGKIDGE